MPSYNTLSGLDQLINNKELQSKVKGNVGYLCHSASVDKDLNHGLAQIKNIFNDRFKKVFAPQHGLVSNVQDNMIETDHYLHSYFNLKIYSLYSETRVPTDEMLEGLDSILVDLQDVNKAGLNDNDIMVYDAFSGKFVPIDKDIINNNDGGVF